jgi:gas vesicle protein
VNDTLTGALIGGAAAIVGGLLATWWQTASQRRATVYQRCVEAAEVVSNEVSIVVDLVSNYLQHVDHLGRLDKDAEAHIERTLERASPEIGRASATLRMYGTDALREAVDRYSSLAREAVSILDRRRELTSHAREQLAERFRVERREFHRVIRSTFRVKRIGPS